MDARSVARGTNLRTNEEERACPRCNGAGWEVDARDYDPETGRFVLVEVRCHACRGEGLILVYAYPRPSKRTRTAPCCGCGERLPVRELVEVAEDDPSLTALAGDMLCAGCARKHGVAR